MEVSSDEASADHFPIVGIGASAGGLAATTEILRHVGQAPGIAIVVVHHLAPSHESSLAEIFSKASSLTISVAIEGAKVEPNHVYVVPPNAGLEIVSGVLHPTARPAGSGLFLPIDQFFESLAADAGPRAIAVLLSGTGSDGSRGVESIKAAGGITFAQDESAAYESMPTNAVATGCVDFVFPPERIARELIDTGARPLAADGQSSTDEDESAVREILIALRQGSGIDFMSYKPATIKRRVQRRMLLHRMASFGDYSLFLRRDPAELGALSEDVLIHVTSFFREPAAFAALESAVFPKLIDNRVRGATIRVWVPGCSTGEEVYSLAMSLLEKLEERGAIDVPIKLFATDVSEVVIGQARAGRYPSTIEGDVSEGRLRRFFTQLADGYQIGHEVRDACVFARHDVTRDPPFSKMDLISCRNLMIYLSPALQDRILPLFHYALSEPGYLFLGSSETSRSFPGFAVIDAKQKIYARTSVAPRMTFDFGEPRFATPGPPNAAMVPRASSSIDVHREADRLVLLEFAPPGVIVTDDLAIVQFRGQTGAYLEPLPGVATLDLMRMAREELRLPLRQAIDEARKTRAPSHKTGLHVGYGATHRPVEIEAIPFLVPATQQLFFVVLFKEGAPIAPSVDQGAEPPRKTAPSPVEDQLRDELASTRSYLQSVIEQIEASNEELKAANEEIVSSNEELRSTNEELQTAKEELQATNEELHTVNDEVNERNISTKRLNDDLTNVLSSVEIPIVILGRDSRIRRFTPAAAKVLRLATSDVGRSLSDIKPMIRAPELERMIASVLEHFIPEECIALDEAGRFYQLTVRPYMTTDNRIDGTVLTAVDIDHVKKGEQRLTEARNYSESIVDTIQECLVVLDGDLRVQSANRAFRRTFQVEEKDVVGVLLEDVRGGEWNIPSLKRRLDELSADEPLIDFRVEHEFKKLGTRVFLLNARRIERLPGQKALVLLAFQDLTDKERAEKELKKSEIEFREMLLTAGEGILLSDAAGHIVFFNQTASEIFGYQAQELIGLPVGVLIPEGWRERETPNREVRGLRKDGTDIPLEISLGTMRKESGKLVAAFITDISQRREAERQIREYQEKLQRMAFDAALTEERERRAIAADLHDRIGQSLALAQIKLTSARDGITGELRGALDTAVALIAQSVADARTLTFELSPPVLYDLGLEAALAWLVEDIEKRNGIRIALHDDGSHKPLDEGSAALVFRAVRELFTNVLKHAETKTATLSLRRVDERFHIVVEDGGSGFDPRELARQKPGTAFGLFSVREQIGRLGGTVNIESEPSKGTRVSIHVPIHQSPSSTA